ncbi:cyclin, N-terminal domain protein [Pelomyxa schiedti]|nr:cyclin, N-terminal domain protein [Pelomyxa schiedti]
MATMEGAKDVPKTTNETAQQQPAATTASDVTSFPVLETTPPGQAHVASAVALLLSTLVRCTAEAQSRGRSKLDAATCAQFSGPGGQPPAIGIEDYLIRIETHSGCTRSALVAALVYVDRVLHLNPLFAVTEGNVHRLILTCIVLAIKHHEDTFYTNAYYSKVGGVSLAEMNVLEVRLLNLLHFELYISDKQFAVYEAALKAALDAVEQSESESDSDDEPSEAAHKAEQEPVAVITPIPRAVTPVARRCRSASIGASKMRGDVEAISPIRTELACAS